MIRDKITANVKRGKNGKIYRVSRKDWQAG